MGNIIGPQVCSNCELFDNKIASLEKQNCIFRKYSDMTYLSTIAAAQHSQIFGDMEARHINKLRLLQQPPLPSRPSFLPNSKNYRSSVIFRMDILILHSNNPILLQSDIPRETGPSQGWHDP